MVFFPWSKDYSVGIRLIDNDHKALVEAINNLHEAIQMDDPDREVDVALSFLARYVREHFQREEQLMADYGYPDLLPHKATHRKLARTVHAIRKVHAQHPGQFDYDKLMGFLRDWLLHHIVGSDMKYVPYLRGEAKARAPQGDRKPVFSDWLPRELATVQLEVPPDKVELIERCAALLKESGRPAKALAELADPVAGMTMQEAVGLVKHLLRE